MDFADIDDRIPVTTFRISYQNDDPCTVCLVEFDLDDEACFVDDELVHLDCVTETHRARS